MGFVKAVEVGEDLRPYIHTDLETEETVRVVVSPDHSGSTCSWSDVATAFAYALQEEGSRLGVEVAVISNYNGKLELPGAEGLAWSALGRFDVFLYLGDTDGLEEMECLAQKGIRVVALDNSYSSARATSRRRFDVRGVVWIDGVAGRDPGSFVEALRLLTP